VTTLGELLETVAHDEAASRIQVLGIEYDSRRVTPGSVFFAFAGSKLDGRQFAAQAIEKGAAAVVSESAAPANFPAPWIQVPHGRRTLATVARRFYDYPDRKLRLTGITGTNGKTTTAYVIDECLRALGRKTGMSGTVENRIIDKTYPAVNTTPESLDLARMFADVAAGGGTECTLEVSSHGLELGRVHGFDFHTAIFTNLTRDHMDLHQTMERYFAAKQMLFDGAGGAPPRFAVINHDDEWGRRIRVPQGAEVLGYGLSPDAPLRAVGIETGIDGVRFAVEHLGRRHTIVSKLTGVMNVYNLLAAFCGLIALGIDADQAAGQLSICRGAPGRFERVDLGQPFLVVVDYAHTDDALRNVIQAARRVTKARVITVFGCGGDRDRTKRPLMGIAAAELSDFVIVTSDNPRSEDPLLIINDILVGIQKCDTPFVVEAERREAIVRAIGEARPGDVVLLAGKGHESYQILPAGTIHFDDREEAGKVLAALGYGRSGVGDEN